MKRRTVGFVVVLVGLVMGACSGASDPAEVTTSTPEPTTTVEAVDPPTTTTAPGLPPFSQDSINPGQQEAYSFVSGSGVEIEYLLYVPDDYEDRAWPLILSLHGFLGSDLTLERVRTQSPLAFIDPSVEFPFVVVAPLGPSGLWSQYHEPMDELFDVLGEALSLDPEARFLTGLSAGTIGTWQWALARPDQFAGIAPIAGGGSMSGEVVVPEDICRLVDLPIWVAHSEADEEVPIESDAATVAELEECGSTVVRFTVYEDLGHWESISTAYAGPDLYEWMLEQVP
jgi:predicted peptidase